MNDTLGYTKMLEEVGDPREKAEATVRIIKDMITENYITKNDLEIFEMRMDSRFEKVKSDFTITMHKSFIIYLSLAITVLKFIL